MVMFFVFPGFGYDFLGCRFHGHFCKAGRRVKDPNTRLTMGEMYRLTQIRQAKLTEALNGNYFAVWECDFDRVFQTSDELREFASSLDLPPPLRVREALDGGRTEAIYTLHDCQTEKGDKIRYLDYCVSV